jgi:hypothetical protein
MGMTMKMLLLCLMTLTNVVGVESINYGEQAPILRIHMTDMRINLILDAIARQTNMQIAIDVRMSDLVTQKRMTVDWNGTDWVKSVEIICQELRMLVVADPSFQIGPRDDVFVRPELVEMNGQSELAIRLEIRKLKKKSFFSAA